MTGQSNIRKALVLSVGTTADPIVNAVEELTTREHGEIDIYLVYGRSLPGQPQPYPVDIATKVRQGLELPGVFMRLFEIDDPQDLDRCICVFEDVFDSIAKDSVSETIVNITGGTKAMAGALTLVAVQNNPACLVFEYTGGDRGDKNGRVTGAMVRKQFKNTALEQYLKLIKAHVRKCNYSQALVLCALLPSSARASFLKRSLESLVLWDNFEYKASIAKIPGTSGINILKEDKLFAGIACMMENLRKCDAIRRVVAEIVQYENKQGNPFEFKGRFNDEPLLLVADTLENARRRLEEKKYVDVAMRTYRSMEVSIQLCLLRKWGISPWGLREDQVADTQGYLTRIKYTALPDRLALNNGFELIQHLDGDFSSGTTNDFKYVRNMRNVCCLEHGYNDITSAVAEQCLPKAENVCLDILLRAGYSRQGYYDACHILKHNIV